MERYDYEEEVLNDVIEYIRDHYDINELKENFENKDGFYQDLYDDLFVSDSVTGNASGSYYCNAWRAEEALCHNLDLLADALEEFGDDLNPLRDGAEACDVTIRCYMLGQVLGDAIDNIENEIEDYISIVDYIEDQCKIRFEELFNEEDEDVDSIFEDEINDLKKEYGYNPNGNWVEKAVASAINEFVDWYQETKGEYLNEREI